MYRFKKPDVTQQSRLVAEFNNLNLFWHTLLNLAIYNTNTPHLSMTELEPQPHGWGAHHHIVKLSYKPFGS